MSDIKRLDKFISECFELSRSLVSKEIRNKHVSVNGVIIRDPSFKVTVGDKVKLNEIETEVFDKLYFMFNKPKGCVCANEDSNYPIIFSYINEFGIKSCHSVGRLDLDTTGLILITNDGQWSHRISSPKHNFGKTYKVELENEITQEQISKLENGILLTGEKNLTKPAIVDVLSSNEINLTIFEGKYHQVKRMMTSVGNNVINLHRLSIGDLYLDEDLLEGEYRLLTEDEIKLF